MAKIVPTTFNPHTDTKEVKVEERKGEWIADFATFRDPRLFDKHIQRLGLKLRDAEIDHRRAHPDIPLHAEF